MAGFPPTAAYAPLTTPGVWRRRERPDVTLRTLTAALPTVMATPPTVEAINNPSFTANPASTLATPTDHVLTSPADGSSNAGVCFLYGQPQFTMQALPNGAGNAPEPFNSIAGTGSSMWFYEFDSDAPVWEALYLQGGGCSYRLMVDGQWATAADVATAGTNNAMQRLVVRNVGQTTTLSAQATSGQATAQTPVAPTPGDVLVFEAGTANEEAVRVLSVTGAGPYTSTLATNLAFTHAAASAVQDCVRAFHRFVVATSGNFTIRKFTTGPTDNFLIPAAQRVRVAILTDSFGTASGLDALQHVAAAALGWDEVITDALGGTGYLNPGSGVTAQFSTRISRIAAANPDVLIVAGGLNDYSMANWTTAESGAVSSFFASLAAALPKAKVYVVGPWSDGDTTNANLATINGIIRAATPAAYTFIDTITAPWVTGTGNSGAPANNGNADIVVASDGVHPQQPYGSRYYGLRLAEAMAATWNP